jgi:NAD(P)-dependent dehydrogenase (short-subunit alcohol dehydrogenase family)
VWWSAATLPLRAGLLVGAVGAVGLAVAAELDRNAVAVDAALELRRSAHCWGRSARRPGWSPRRREFAPAATGLSDAPDEEAPVRTVLITGTSSGFGLHTTVLLARQGWQVIATMRDLGKRAALDQAIAAAGVAERVRVERLDVTDTAAMRDVVARLLEPRGGQLEAVVHNAGVAVGAAFEDLPEPQLRLVMETNFFGVLALTRLLLPTFRAQRRGRIVVVSSNSAYAGEPANSIYCASKWAVEGWAESIAYELDPFGIDVVLVEPGPYRTEIWNSSPRIKPPGSAYLPLLDKLEQAIDAHVAKDARDPQEVAVVIAQALAAARPRFRYPVSPQAKIAHVLRGKVPSRWLRKGVSRLLGIDRVRL